MEEFLGIWGVISLYNLILSAVGIAFYVLYALGLYTIAKRRGIEHPWMAWIPIVDLWLLGAIADSYRLAARNEKKNRRTALLILTIVVIVLVIAALAIIIGSAIDLAIRADQFHYDNDLLSDFFIIYFSGAGMLLLTGAIAVAQMVLQYICLYDLYGSCDPDNKVLYLLLSLLFNLAPIFVFVCRNKDLGMQTIEPRTNRYQRPPYQYSPYQQPPYQQPPYQQPPYQQPPITPPDSTEE